MVSHTLKHERCQEEPGGRMEESEGKTLTADLLTTYKGEQGGGSQREVCAEGRLGLPGTRQPSSVPGVHSLFSAPYDYSVNHSHIFVADAHDKGWLARKAVPKCCIKHRWMHTHIHTIQHRQGSPVCSGRVRGQGPGQISDLCLAEVNQVSKTSSAIDSS